MVQAVMPVETANRRLAEASGLQAQDEDQAASEATARQAQQGDQSAFAQLVERHQRGVANFAYCLLGDWEAALDIAQEAFVQAYSSLGRYDPARPFKPWLYRIALNLCYGHLRRAGRHPTVALDESELELGAEGEEAGDPVRRAEQQELIRAVEGSLGMLPERYRAVLLLRHMEEMSYTQIAETLGKPLGTVKTDLHRARDLLRTALLEKGVIR
jgi:RNA polymerase sigma-70 factor (ECF subfamily)